jgi:hypothetical protein
MTGPHVVVGFAVPLLAGSAVIAATYFLGTSLASRWEAAISAVLVASCPIVITYSRSYHFALPAALMTTMALFALLRSNRFRHVGWASAFGLSLGLMPLARTMTIAFVPGVVLGAIVYAVVDRQDRRRRSFILAWSLLLGLATTAAWLWPNRRYVFDYLLDFGYGNHAPEFGPPYSRFGFAAWLNEARTFVAYVYLPHFCIMLAGVLSLLWLAGQRIIRNGLWAAFGAFAHANVLPIVIFIAEALVALSSTQNKGSAFIAPIVPAGIVLAVWSCSRFEQRPMYRRAMAAAATLVAVLATVPSIDLSLSRIWSIDAPFLGPSTIIDGRGTIQIYEAAGGFASTNSSEPIGSTEGRVWVDVSVTTATKIRQLGGASTPTAFGFRHRLYNVNTVGLQQWIKDGGWTALIQVDPIVTGDTVAGDLYWLTRGDAATACLLLTSEGDTAQFVPLVDQVRMVDGAKQAGFQSVAAWTLPDGQKVVLWKRYTQPRCNEGRAGSP